jgi:Zn-dependent peptidase ImmA (M78 family)
MASGWRGPPFGVVRLATRQGIRVRAADLADDQDGCLLPGSPPTVYVNRNKPKVRARYTVAHEIVHSLLPEVPRTTGRRYWRYRVDAQSPVEQLCQVGAAEVLMPTGQLKEFIGVRRESLRLAHEIRRHFCVSLEAAARNLTDLSQHRCAMVVLRLMNKPSEKSRIDEPTFPGFEAPAPPKRLRVFYAWTSRPWDDRFLPPFKSVPDDSIAYSAMREGVGRREILSSEEDWAEVGGVGFCRVEAVAHYSAEADQTVLCLLVPADSSG